MLNLEQQIFKQLNQAQDILIVFPKNQTGDSLVSALAFFIFLKNQGKQITVAGEVDSDNDKLSFVPSYQSIKKSLLGLRRFIVSVDISKTKVSQIRYTVEQNKLNFILSPDKDWLKPEDVSIRAGEFKHDLIIVIGANNLEELGSIYDENVEFFYKTPVVNLDNKPSNEDFGQINFIDLNAVSISELTFYLLKNYQKKESLITPEIATCLLTGIIQSTKNFKNANLTPRTLLTSSELISLGAEREKIITHLYRSRNVSTLKLWGKVLNNLQTERHDTILWSKLFASGKLNSLDSLKNLDDVIDELIISVPQAELVLIFYEKNLAETEVIAYSLKNVNLLNLLSSYSPQGTSRRALFSLEQDLDTAHTLIIPALKNRLDKLNA